MVTEVTTVTTCVFCIRIELLLALVGVTAASNQLVPSCDSCQVLTWSQSPVVFDLNRSVVAGTILVTLKVLLGGVAVITPSEPVIVTPVPVVEKTGLNVAMPAIAAALGAAPLNVEPVTASVMVEV